MSSGLEADRTAIWKHIDHVYTYIIVKQLQLQMN